jgi:Helix-turn-helix domain
MTHETSSDESKRERNTIVVEDEVLRAGFTQIPNLLLRREDITPGAKLTYMVLLSYAWQSDSCFPGHDRLATDMGVAKRSVVTYLQQLKDKGMIIVERRGLGQTNVYRLPRLTTSTPTPRSAKSALQEMQNPTHPDVQNLPSKKDTGEEDTTEKKKRSSNIRKASPAKKELRQNTPLGETLLPEVGLHSHEEPLLGEPETRGLQLRGGQTPADGARSSARGLTALSDLLVSRQKKTPSTDLTEPQKPYPQDRQRILTYVEDFAIQLGDEAPLPSSVSRAYNLYTRSGMPVEAFTSLMYEARALTQEYSANIKKRKTAEAGPFGPGKNKMAYFFATLEALVLRSREGNAQREQ